MAYIDTSVLVACYAPQQLSAAAERAVRKSPTPTISPLTEVEFCSALALKTRTKEIELGAAKRLLAAFRLHVNDGVYRIVPIGSREYDLAREWISAFAAPLRTLDGLHLAAAFTNGLLLLTADKALGRSAKRFGVECRLVGR